MFSILKRLKVPNVFNSEEAEEEEGEGYVAFLLFNENKNI
jgi:hypothetical protein